LWRLMDFQRGLNLVSLNWCCILEYHLNIIFKYVFPGPLFSRKLLLLVFSYIN
jgi:hypothetical protein